jgi:RNA polymerase sigma-70 factor (ECF subfamily)
MEPDPTRSLRNASFAELARELSPDLRRYLQRYVGDAAAAEDLLQETLARIDRGLADFAGRSSVKTWAFSIATRVAADDVRKPERRAEIVEMDETRGGADPEPSIDERLVVDEMSGCLRRVIDSLPEEYRAPLVLHELQGLTAEETAAACGSSVPTAKIRIHRARLRLKAALQDECTFYRDADDVFRCDRKQS